MAKPNVQNIVDPEKHRNWLRLQREIHGSLPGLPDELLDGTTGQPLNRPQPESTLLEAAAEVIASGKQYEVAGRQFILHEPTMGQLKRFLLPAAGKISRAMEGSAASDKELLAAVSATGEFQALMLECVQFTDGKEEPANRVDWFDDLPLSNGLDLVDAFAEGLNWHLLIEKAKQLAAKIRGTRVQGVPVSKR